MLPRARLEYTEGALVSENHLDRLLPSAIKRGLLEKLRGISQSKVCADASWRAEVARS